MLEMGGGADTKFGPNSVSSAKFQTIHALTELTFQSHSTNQSDDE